MNAALLVASSSQRRKLTPTTEHEMLDMGAVGSWAWRGDSVGRFLSEVVGGGGWAGMGGKSGAGVVRCIASNWHYRARNLMRS